MKFLKITLTLYFFIVIVFSLIFFNDERNLVNFYEENIYHDLRNINKNIYNKLLLETDNIFDDLEFLSESEEVSNFLKSNSGISYNNITLDMKNIVINIVNDMEKFKFDNYNLSNEQLLEDERFRDIVIRDIRSKGYTLLFNQDNFDIVFHKIKEFEGVNFKMFEEKSPLLYDMIEDLNIGQDKFGFYQWQDLDGEFREKYVYCSVSDKLNLSPCATDYVETYNLELRDVKLDSDEISYFKNFHKYKDIILVDADDNVVWSTSNKHALWENVNSVYYNNSMLKQIYSQSKDVESEVGSSFIVKTNKFDIQRVFAVRKIFNINNKHIGTLIFEIDIKIIRDKLIFLEHSSDLEFFIFNSKNFEIISGFENINELNLKIELGEIKEYCNQEIVEKYPGTDFDFRGEKYIGSYKIDYNSEWCYFSVIELKSLNENFKKKSNSLFELMIPIFSLFFIFTLLFGLYLDIIFKVNSKGKDKNKEGLK